jgi:hypothetical protein
MSAMGLDPRNGPMEATWMDHTGYVHLLLDTPGDPGSVPDGPGRAWVMATGVMVDVVDTIPTLRFPPVGGKADRVLAAAIASREDEPLAALVAQGGAVGEVAALLLGGRLMAFDPLRAVEVLAPLVQSPTNPADNKVIRRYWDSLHVQVHLAPSVPALIPVGRLGISLLLVEALGRTGRVGDAIAVLDQLPPHPAVLLSRVALLLQNHEHGAALEATAGVVNLDDLHALILVSRSVAARAAGNLDAALDAVCDALSSTERKPAVLAVALEERAYVYSLVNDELAARADMEVLALMIGGAREVSIPKAAARRRGGDDEVDGLERARKRMRRRITGVGAPGTFGGRHHSTYREEIAVMFTLGQLDAAEELLLGLLDVVEDEVAEKGIPLDPTFFLTLADLYQDSGRNDDLHALAERFTAAEAAAEATLAAREAANVSVSETVSLGEGSTAPPVEAFVDPTLDPLEAALPSAEPVSLSGASEEMSARSMTMLRSVLTSDNPPPADAPSGIMGAAEELPEPELTPVQRAVRGPRVRSL